jgi:protein-L-isoaspartate(D-aspartate) O-methyltransferase
MLPPLACLLVANTLQGPSVAVATEQRALTATQTRPERMDQAQRKAQADRLVREIEQDVRETSALLGTDRLDPRVLDAIRSVPRERFVPDNLQHEAYRNNPLPIGSGQTISQPYIVAVMSHLLDLPADGGRVFELGTGSGYQATVLGALGAEVYSVEIVPELAAQASQRLARLGFDAVHVRSGDGYQGWPEQAPFDAIIVTAAGPEIPQPLVDQLKVGGRLVMPLGPIHLTQSLILLTKQSDGQLGRREVLPVRFVPITRDSDHP